MAAGRLLNPPDHLELSSGNVSQNWKRFKQKWSNYELAIGIARKEDLIWVATFLTVIGDEALDVYNAFTWDSDKDKVKMDKVLEHFEQYCEPRKNTIYERYIFFSRGQESREPIDKYATIPRNMADSREFQDLKDSLIRDCIVFGIADNNVRERLLRVPDLTLNKAPEIARAAEATQSQLKQMQNLHEVNAVGKKKEKFFQKKQKEMKKSANSTKQSLIRENSNQLQSTYKNVPETFYEYATLCQQYWPPLHNITYSSIFQQDWCEENKKKLRQKPTQAF